MFVTKKHRERMDRASPLFDEADVVFNQIDTPFIITYEVTAGAVSGLEIFKANAPFKFEILDVIIQSRGTDGTGTVKVKGVGDITDAMTCAVDTTMARAASIDDDYSTIEKNGTLEVVCAGGTVANVKCLVTIVAREVD